MEAEQALAGPGGQLLVPAPRQGSLTNLRRPWGQLVHWRSHQPGLRGFVCWRAGCSSAAPRPWQKGAWHIQMEGCTFRWKCGWARGREWGRGDVASMSGRREMPVPGLVGPAGDLSRGHWRTLSKRTPRGGLPLGAIGLPCGKQVAEKQWAGEWQGSVGSCGRGPGGRW